jgi:N-acylneuraminate cytidylyltransferase
LVWRHALDYLSKSDPISYDGLVSIPATAPLRIAEDVENCLNEFEKGDSDIVITVSDAHRNPYFNMVEIHESGLSTLVMSPTQTIFRRQDAPEVYDMTTVAYVANFDYIQKASGIFDGRVRSVHVPLERSLDIDTLMDFKFAEYLIHNQEGEAL